MTRILIGLAGIVVILGLAVALSTNRRAIRLRVVGAAFALQAGIAVLVLYVPWGKSVLAFLSGGVSNLLGYAKAGVDFIFGPLASPEIGGNSFAIAALPRSEEHTSELQSLMRISYAVFCLKKKNKVKISTTV